MSDIPTDPTGAGGPPGQEGEPSEEEVRAYLSQLRSAPVDQVVAEVASALLNAAQVKLGRSDGRLLLDLTASLNDQVRGVLPEELTGQLDDVLAQLRLAQVQAEKDVAEATAQGHTEEGDLSGAPSSSAPSSGATAAPPQAPSGGQPSAASRLWTPGR